MDILKIFISLDYNKSGYHPLSHFLLFTTGKLKNPSYPGFSAGRRGLLVNKLGHGSSQIKTDNYFSIKILKICVQNIPLPPSL